jgi:hypothetical protein
MKFLPLTLRNLMRRPFRTILTFGATAVSFLLFGVLMILKVAFTMGVEVAGVDRLMMTNKMSIIQPLPIAYLERIKAVDNVTLVTHQSWFGGIYQDPKNNVFEFAVDPPTWTQMYPEFKVPPKEFEAWLADRQGAVVGKDLAARFGWKIGDTIPIKGTFNRPKGGDGVTWQFHLVGIYDGDKSVDKTQFLFRYDYLDENRTLGTGVTGWYLIKVSDPSRSAETAKKIDSMFENSAFRNEDGDRKGGRAGVRQSGRQHRRDRERDCGGRAVHRPAHCGKSDVAVDPRADEGARSTEGHGLHGRHRADARPRRVRDVVGAGRRPGVGPCLAHQPRRRSNRGTDADLDVPATGHDPGPRPRGSARRDCRNDARGGRDASPDRHGAEEVVMRALKQLVTVTLVGLYTIPQRLSSSIVAVVGIAGVVVVLVAVLSIGEGFKAAMVNAGHTDRAIVMRSGADSEMSSGLSGPETEAHQTGSRNSAQRIHAGGFG